MKKTDFYRLLGEAVRYSPESENKYDQLQTFVVMRSLADLNAESFGRTSLDRFRNFFYSRRWEDTGYTSSIQPEFPALIAIDRSARLTNFMRHPGNIICPQIQLAVVYPNVERIEGTTPAACEALVSEEIYDLTEKHLLYVLEYIAGAVYASTDVNPVPAWYNSYRLMWEIDQGDIATFSTNQLETNRFVKDMQANNASAVINYIDDVSVNKLCGVSMDVVFCGVTCSSGINAAFTAAVDCCNQNV